MRPRRTGRLLRWDEAKGYGLIAPDDGGARLFVDAKAFGRRAWRPQAGERLSFVLAQDAQGRPRAQELRSLESRGTNQPVKRPRAGAGAQRRLLAIPAFAAWVLLCHALWGLPQPLWGSYFAMSLASFIVYYGDKRAAQRGAWRVAESTLQGLALACGWPGALLAQSLLRHKSAKPSFQRVFWACVLLNVLGFTLIFTPLGRLLLNTLS